MYILIDLSIAHPAESGNPEFIGALIDNLSEIDDALKYRVSQIFPSLKVDRIESKNDSFYKVFFTDKSYCLFELVKLPKLNAHKESKPSILIAEEMLNDLKCVLEYSIEDRNFYSGLSLSSSKRREILADVQILLENQDHE